MLSRILTSSFWPVSLFGFLVLCDAATSNITHTLVPIEDIYTFPGDENYAENLIFRRNGKLLITTYYPSADLYEVDPFHPESTTFIHHFDGYGSIFGIVEAKPDVFLISAGSADPNNIFAGTPGSYAILEIDCRFAASCTSPNVSTLVQIPTATGLDGFVVVNEKKGLSIVADASVGALFLVDSIKRTATNVLQSDLLRSSTPDPKFRLKSIGINGLKRFGSDLFFTNTGRGIYGKIPIDLDSGLPQSEPVVLTNYGMVLDDLAFDKSGNAFITVETGGVLFRPAGTTLPDETFQITPGAATSAATFGRLRRDRCTLYILYSPDANSTTSHLGRFDVRGISGYHGIC